MKQFSIRISFQVPIQLFEQNIKRTFFSGFIHKVGTNQNFPSGILFSRTRFVQGFEFLNLRVKLFFLFLQSFKF